MNQNQRTYVSSPATNLLWFVVGPLMILWMLLPIYLIGRIGAGGGIFLLLINSITGAVVLRWVNSFHHLSYDDRYVYLTKFGRERKFELTAIKRIRQDNFQKINFKIETNDGDVFNFVPKYNLKLMFNDWPENLVELTRRMNNANI